MLMHKNEFKVDEDGFYIDENGYHVDQYGEPTNDIFSFMLKCIIGATIFIVLSCVTADWIFTSNQTNTCNCSYEENSNNESLNKEYEK